jgi:hypothetical protein
VIITSRNPDWRGTAPSLAVDQAANLLSATSLTPQDYLDALAKQTARLLARGSSEAQRSAAGSWAVSFDHLAENDPAALALLTTVAWLAPEPVPLTLFTEHPELLPAPLTHAAGETQWTSLDDLVHEVSGLLRGAGDYLLDRGEPQAAHEDTLSRRRRVRGEDLPGRP